jgi:radical SAM protein with 4Fe4S-binding SPASM domain
MLARVARRAQADGIVVRAANNIGYFGPYERLIRGEGGEWSFWKGCGAGINTLGIEADGTLKGCPSLPTRAYAGGNLRDRPLRDILEHAPELNFNVGRGTPEALDALWGFCRTCEFAEICYAGCAWTAHVFFDRRGNNPYCHHRAITHDRLGERERVVLNQQAPGRPFDNGTFALVVESRDAPWPEDDALRFTADRVRWPPSWVDADCPSEVVA